MVFINIAWGLVNLLPVLPLDGGRISEAILIRFRRYDGHRWAAILGAVVAGSVAAFFAYRHEDYGAIMFGLLCLSNFQALRTLPGEEADSEPLIGPPSSSESQSDLIQHAGGDFAVGHLEQAGIFLRPRFAGRGAILPGVPLDGGRVGICAASEADCRKEAPGQVRSCTQRNMPNF